MEEWTQAVLVLSLCAWWLWVVIDTEISVARMVHRVMFWTLNPDAFLAFLDELHKDM